jgi:hypothetical protein
MSIRVTFPGGRTKALTLSYDDGRDHDRRLVKIFNDYGLKGTFHLNGGMLNSEVKVSLEELATLYKGHEVACHALTHPFLERLPRTEVMREVWKDREILEQYVSYPVTGMSYPYGSSDAAVVEILRNCGIEYCRTTVATKKLTLPDDLLLWHPTCHHRDMLEMVPGFLGYRFNLGVLYVWGHSYEFANADNWGDMERFAEQVAGKEDVWYVTNIDLARYIKAFRALVTSTDGRRAYNPSAVTVWIASPNGPVPVAPGAVVEI